MHQAIRLSEDNMLKGRAPFGAVIVKDGEVVATGENRVWADTDPTAHAEVTAIRIAARKLGTFDLSGCEIYTSCEPCPMCLAAIYWAKIEKIYYGNTSAEAEEAGFDDTFIYQQLTATENVRKVQAERLLQEEALAVFKKWKSLDIRNEY